VNSFAEDRSVLARPAPPADVVTRYGELEEQIADVRFGAGDAERYPLVVVIHGGFWRPQFDRTHTGPMATAIAKAGWTNASIEYRRIPGKPDATLEDVELALANLPALISRHNGRIVALGHSAGGHLALWVAAKNLADLIGVIALGPAADLQWGEANAIGNHAVRDFLGTSALERRDVDPCQLPSSARAVTIIHGSEDAIAPVAMAENYLQRHAATRLIKVADCGHFAVIDPASAAWAIVLGEIKRLSH